MCSACYTACCTSLNCTFPSNLSGDVPCKEDGCFAFFYREAALKFPVYWKTRDENCVGAIENPFMKEKMQTLIRKSVRPGCGTGCDGRDGDGRGTTSAIVTRVLRIENGPLLKRYWERKKAIKTSCAKRKPPSLEAKSMTIAALFPRAQLDTSINEIFLFHGTNLKSAFAIAEHDGFDPSRSKGLYGQGNYCADYSCKSMQYVGGELPEPGAERIFLICRVLMGRAFRTKDNVDYSGLTAPPKDDDGNECHLFVPWRALDILVQHRWQPIMSI